MARGTDLTRSIDTLQRIYAFMATLAIGEALRRSMLKANGNLSVHWGDLQIPLAIAAIVTIVPFVHGMNRHLDEHAAEMGDAPPTSMVVMLALDFMVFILQSCILIMLAACVSEIAAPTMPRNDRFLAVLVVLLGLDITWTVLRKEIEGKLHKAESKWWWAPTNVVAVVLLLLIWQTPLEADAYVWSIALIATARTVCDYGVNIRFYLGLSKAA